MSKRGTIKFYNIKKEIRNIGIEDGPFSKDSERTILVGAILRGGKWPDGFLKSEIKIDGTDVTEKIIQMINKSRHKDQLRVIFLDGITYGGFNIVNIKKLKEETNMPVIIVKRKPPDMKGIKLALKNNFKDWKERWKIIKLAGEFKKIKINKRFLYVQFIGIKESDIEKILNICCTRSRLPESIRISHLMASAIINGESHGRA